MRHLIHVPIIHQLGIDTPSSWVDEDSLEHRFMMEAQEAFWSDVVGYLSNHRITRVYQDTYYGQDVGVLHDLARMSLNLRTVVGLIDSGSTLEVTESENLAARQMGSLFSGSWEKCRSLRDRYIASRIHMTLHDGETGVLFIGLAHDPLQFLRHQRDILLETHLSPRLPDVVASVDLFFDTDYHSLFVQHVR